MLLLKHNTKMILGMYKTLRQATNQVDIFFRVLLSHTQNIIYLTLLSIFRITVYYVYKLCPLKLVFEEPQTFPKMVSALINFDMFFIFFLILKDLFYY